jgi:hypothetical protein
MTSAEQILFGLASAQSALRRSVLEWDAADLSRLEAAPSVLESSIRPLKAALENTASVANLRGVELKQSALSLKNDVAALERLVDAAAGFLRSVNAGTFECSPAYTFAGETRPDPALPPIESYAG